MLKDGDVGHDVFNSPLVGKDRGKNVVKENVEDDIVDLEDEDPVYSVDEQRFNDGSGSDDIGGQRPKSKEFKVDYDIEDSNFIVAILFGTIKEFNEVVREYKIKNRHNFKFVKNSNDNVSVVCAARGCSWLIYASLKNAYDKKDKTMQGKCYNGKHKCGRVFKNRSLNSCVLAKKYAK